MPALKPVLARLAQGETLSEPDAENAFGLIMQGLADTAEIAALLMALRVRGETLPELIGAVRACRAHMIPVQAPPGAMDVCGTGGDGRHTLNVSTAVAFVLAGAGVPVAKHGNRASSSGAGAADVLAALGIGLDTPPDRQSAILERSGCAFLFAPRHHAALRHAAAARAALGTRTLFNLLGPLINPACVRRQLVGVFDPAWTHRMAGALGATGAEHAWVVHGAGLDELSLDGVNQVSEWRDGIVRDFTVSAADAGLAAAPAEALRGGDATFNAAALRAVLDGTAHHAYRDTVLLNAAAALIVAGRAVALRDGVALAAASIENGRARAALTTLRRETAPHTAPG